MPHNTILQFGFTGGGGGMGRHLLPCRDEDSASSSGRWQHRGVMTAERRFPTMSGGEQMRVDVPRARPEAPLLDEPTTDIRHQHGDGGAHARATGDVQYPHDLNLTSHADRLAVLADGRLAFDAPWPVARLAYSSTHSAARCTMPPAP